MSLKVTRPILRYHGGKWKLGEWIISHFPPHRVYVEPYGGAASVLIQKDRSYAEVYNDLDGEIVNLFRVVRDKGMELKRLLALTPFAREEYQSAWTLTDDPMERARRTVIRAFMGFGSAAATMKHGNKNGAVGTGFRSNSNRSGTAPAHDWQHFSGTGFRSYTGESDGRRECKQEWAESLMQEIQEYAPGFVALFVKQMGAKTPDEGKKLIPAHLNIQEFPSAGRGR